ncbi:MAG: hypothetical protein IKJ37_13870, partial [Kiritimatiellae bacterium]|nr:hypothetical protein [Kiritimatiellia bacterium]
MKKAAKYLILALLVFATVFSVAACEDLGDLNGILNGLNNTDNKTEEWTMETVYSQAKALGYEGT